MTTIDDLQARATALLTKTESTESVEAKGIATTLEALPSVHARDLTIRHDPRPPA